MKNMIDQENASEDWERHTGSVSPDTSAAEVVASLTRPIANFGYRSAAEVFDIMCDRIESFHSGVVGGASLLKAELDTSRAETAAAKRERDEALERVEELELIADTVSAEFEKDCWRAMRSLLNECHYDWHDAEIDGVQADEAREYISTTMSEIEASERRQRDRAESTESLLAEANKARAIWADNAGKSADEVIRLKAEVADLRAKLETARETVAAVIQNTISTDHARAILTEIEGKSK